MNASWQKHTLRFRFEAGTSRGVLTTKDTWFLKIGSSARPGIYGLGECGPLKGLSPDDTPDIEAKLDAVCHKLSNHAQQSWDTRYLLEEFDLYHFPSILFGLETALLDLQNGGRRILFQSDFSKGDNGIAINGLVWMGDESFMRQQLEDKIAQGYTCIKLKIGALDFDTEIRLIESIRKRFDASKISIRVDANGAFSPTEALEKLTTLAKYTLHSIEQPIRAGQPEAMHELCMRSPLAIALDEELIGICSYTEKQQLLQRIQPPYIILKPTLVGGMAMTQEWINAARQAQTGWWITSALESNIGLNAISQYTASLAPELPQGLGTGQLYHNNIPSPLSIEKGFLYYRSDLNWDLSGL
jgi:O-succinylbenzoate synthase